MLKIKYIWGAMYSNDHNIYFLAKYSVDLDQPVKCLMTFAVYAKNGALLIIWLYLILRNNNTAAWNLYSR
jgi:hypothetical protein